MAEPKPSTSVSVKYELSPLAYPIDALEPAISRETLEYHHGRHLRAYVDKLNGLVDGTAMAGQPLKELVRRSTGALFNNAAQVWNHDFYFAGLKPGGASEPAGELGRRLKSSFGSIDKLREIFRKHALDNFGSGWTWLVKTHDGQLVVRNTHDAENTLRSADTALLCCDVWEHAYYIDYRNDRARYVDALWKLMNWDVALQRFEQG
ncbi:MAG: superoxide dismutase [Burkholderiales bacterium]